MDDIILLVVYLPLWRIWARQLGWLFPIYGKNKNVPNHQPDYIDWYRENYDGYNGLYRGFVVDILDLQGSSDGYNGLYRGFVTDIMHYIYIYWI